jgi:predicted dehydrogenase
MDQGGVALLRAGIIGCGRIVEEGHLPAFEALLDRVRVVAISDPVEARLELIGEALNVPESGRYTDYHDMIRRDDLDFVDLALPHFLHEEVIVACAKAGITILTEKPLTTSVESADRIVAALDETGTKLCVIHNYRHQPASAKALELVRAGKIGKPFLIRYEYLGGGHYPGTAGYDPDWRTKSSRGGGGALLDNGYHYLYMAEALMGSPIVQAFGRVGTWVQKQDVEDVAVVLLAHEGGGTTSLQFGWGIKGGGVRVGEVHGTEGSIRFNARGAESPLEIHENAVGEWKPVDLEGADTKFTNSFLGMVDEFLTALEKGDPMPISVQDARHNLALVMAGYESSRTGQAVSISDITGD